MERDQIVITTAAAIAAAAVISATVYALNKLSIRKQTKALKDSELVPDLKKEFQDSADKAFAEVIAESESADVAQAKTAA